MRTDARRPSAPWRVASMPPRRRSAPQRRDGVDGTAADARRSRPAAGSVDPALDRRVARRSGVAPGGCDRARGGTARGSGTGHPALHPLRAGADRGARPRALEFIAQMLSTDESGYILTTSYSSSSGRPIRAFAPQPASTARNPICSTASPRSSERRSRSRTCSRSVRHCCSPSARPRAPMPRAGPRRSSRRNRRTAAGSMRQAQWCPTTGRAPQLSTSGRTPPPSRSRRCGSTRAAVATTSHAAVVPTALRRPATGVAGTARRIHDGPVACRATRYAATVKSPFDPH